MATRQIGLSSDLLILARLQLTAIINTSGVKQLKALNDRSMKGEE
jgi:hypothetical protein